MRKFHVPRLLLGDWLCISHQPVRETVLCIACFAYSLLVVVFPLTYRTVFVSTHEFYLLSVLLPIPLGARGGVSERPLVLSCQLLS